MAFTNAGAEIGADCRDVGMGRGIKSVFSDYPPQLNSTYNTLSKIVYQWHKFWVNF